MYSVHSRQAERIDLYAGYNGQAVRYGSYMIACLFAPFVANSLKPKWALLMSSLTYTIYCAGFLYLNYYFYYFSCALVGVGYALFYAGLDGFMTSHSSRKTIERNNAVAWSIGCNSMLVGGLFLAITITLQSSSSSGPSALNESNSTSNKATNTSKYRLYSDSEITVMYSILTAITMISNILFAKLPSQPTPDCIDPEPKKIPAKQQAALLLKSFATGRVLLLVPLFAHIGFFKIISMIVYPTTFAYTKSLSNQVYLLSIYSVAMGLGEHTMCTFITIVSRAIRDFTLRFMLWMLFACTVLYATLLTASVPAEATVRTTDDAPLFFDSSVYIIAFVGFLFGFLDCGINCARSVIVAIALPKHRTQAFSISKFYQAMASSGIVFFSSMLSIYAYSAILSAMALISAICCTIVTWSTVHQTKKDVENEETK